MDADENSGFLELRRHDGDSEVHEGFLFEDYESEGPGYGITHFHFFSCSADAANCGLLTWMIFISMVTILQATIFVVIC